jgi:hypothetical protein
MKKILLLITLLFALLIASCGSVTATPSTPPPTQTESTPMPHSTPVYANNPALVNTAVQDLTQRLFISSDLVTIKGSYAVTWPDSSLGCPQKGVAYAEVLTPGYLVVLGYEGVRYEYHSGSDGKVTYCKNPTAPVNGSPGDN